MRIFITGGSSMIGQALCERLKNHEVCAPTHQELDLINFNRVSDTIYNFRPQIVFHLAGYNGGIEWNRQYPSKIFYRNVQMGLNVLQATDRIGVKSVVSVMASCAYPDGKDLLKEEEFWCGLPHETVECHGLAKRTLHAFSRQLQKMNDTRYISLCLTNCYGPNDSFHPQKTKVAGAMIRKIVDAKQQELPEIMFWGTGNPRRELMFSEDAADAIFGVATNFDGELINVGTGTDCSIKELAETIATIVGYEGELKWDTSRPDGQMKKLLCVDKLNSIGWKPKYSLVEGLTKTINWYIDNKKMADNKPLKM